MTLFNIGPGELLLILIVAMVVLGPQRLPEAARKAGRALRSARQFIRNIDPQLLADFRELTRDLDVMREEVDGLRAEMAGLQQELAGAARDVNDSVSAALDAARHPELAEATEGSVAPDQPVPVSLTANTAPAAVSTAPGHSGEPDPDELIGEVLRPLPRTAAHTLEARPRANHTMRPRSAGAGKVVVRPLTVRAVPRYPLRPARLSTVVRRA